MINRSRDVREGRWLCQQPALKASCQNSSAAQLAFIPRAFSGMRWYFPKRLCSLRAHVERGLMVNKIV